MRIPIAKRIKEAMELRQIRQTDLVKQTGIGKSSISTYISGEYEPKQDNIFKLAKALRVSESWLMGYDVPMENPSPLKVDCNVDITDIMPVPGGVRIPVLGEVAAGSPIFAEEEYIGEEEISKELAATGTFFALKIRGDSMSPRIAPGDVVIVRKQDYAESGDIIIVIINGDTATCKKFVGHNDSITLIPLNPTYEPKTYTNLEVATIPILILGKVVENRQKY